MAGIMGGARSAVARTPRDLLLEVAWFDPGAVVGRARRATDCSPMPASATSAGVDPAGQERALERATELICAIAGGRAGPACLEELRRELPTRSRP